MYSMGVACELKKKVIFINRFVPMPGCASEIIGLIEKKKGKSDFSW